MCEAGRNVPRSSCGLPWTGEVSGVAVDMVPVIMDLQHTCSKKQTALLHQRYRSGCRHRRSSGEESRDFVQLCHKLCKLKDNDVNKCQNLSAVAVQLQQH